MSQRTAKNQLGIKYFARAAAASPAPCVQLHVQVAQALPTSMLLQRAEPEALRVLVTA